MKTLHAQAALQGTDAEVNAIPDNQESAALLILGEKVSAGNSVFHCFHLEIRKIRD